MSDTLRIGIIGGSGLYEMEGLTDIREQHVETPFGAPSGAYLIGRLEGVGLRNTRESTRGSIGTI